MGFLAGVVGFWISVAWQLLVFCNSPWIFNEVLVFR